MITRLSIKNFKSIVDLNLELGRINVFIGENGSGKTNILEAVAMAGAGTRGRFEVHELYERGVRIARPSMMCSDFAESPTPQEIRRSGEIQTPGEVGDLWQLEMELEPIDPSSIHSAWRSNADDIATVLAMILTAAVERVQDPSSAEGNLQVVQEARRIESQRQAQDSFIRSFCIYNPTFLALRGVEVSSRLHPVGLHGENLDVLLVGLSDEKLNELSQAASIIPWLAEFVIDREDQLKLEGHKLGRSVSRLYFRDRFMLEDNNLFSAENANEGILHLLFYMALFSSPRTPAFFGIDNIENRMTNLYRHCVSGYQTSLMNGWGQISTGNC